MSGTTVETLAAQPEVPSLQVKLDSSIKPEETNLEDQELDPLEPQDSPKRKVAFRCKICEKQFPRLRESQNHLAALHRVHATRQSHELQVRERSDQTRNWDYQSVNLDITKMRSPFRCPVCGQTFARKYSLFWHLDKDHTGSRSLFQCPICVKEFTWEPLLKAHYEKDHSDPRPGPDPQNTLSAKLIVQARKFRRYSHLTPGTNYYQCTQCDLKFPSAKLLQAHCRSLNEAGQTSKGRTHLRVYRVGGLLEACPICPCMFLTKEAFHLHVCTIHPEAKFPCPNCSERFENVFLLEDHRSKVHLHGYVEEVNGKIEVIPNPHSVKTEIKVEPSSMDLILGI